MVGRRNGVVGASVAGEEDKLLVRGIHLVEADAGFERRTDAAGEDLGHERIMARPGNGEMIHVNLVSGIVDRIGVRGISGIGGVVEWVVADRARDLDDPGEVTSPRLWAVAAVSSDEAAAPVRPSIPSTWNV